MSRGGNRGGGRPKGRPTKLVRVYEATAAVIQRHSLNRGVRGPDAAEELVMSGIEKTGRPGVGLREARALNPVEIVEAHRAGLDWVDDEIVIMREHGTDRITFWYEAEGGGLNAAGLSRENGNALRDLLEGVWEKSASLEPAE